MKQRGDLPAFRVVQGRARPATEQNDPDHQSHGQQDLPAPAQVEVFPPLVSEPEPEVVPGVD